jgi:hypothetical protein
MGRINHLCLPQGSILGSGRMETRTVLELPSPTLGSELNLARGRRSKDPELGPCRDIFAADF